MLNLNNLLYSFERNPKGFFLQNKNCSLFEENLSILYKGNETALKQDLAEILSFSSIENFKNLYTQFFPKSTHKICVYSNIKMKIAKQVIPSIDSTNNLGEGLLKKIILFFQESFLQSIRYIKLKHNIQNECIFLEDVTTFLRTQIYRLSYRTFIFDFHINKQKGVLTGKSEEEQLKNYNITKLRNEQYIIQFFDSYPCLLRMICNTMRKLKKIILELLGYYESDKKKIAQKLLQVNTVPKIKKLYLDLGDTHNDGRKTIGIQLEKNKIMFKPRNVTAESFFYNVIKKWNDRLSNLDYYIKVPKGIYHQKYSWSEYISFEACSEIKEIHSFYKRIGVQLAFLYAFNAVDLHYENIIANGSHPVIIDLECLFAIPKKILQVRDGISAHDKIQQVLSNSVRSTGLLPLSIDKEKDISGIGNGNLNHVIITSPQIIQGNNDSIKVKEADSKYTIFKKNQPKLQGTEIAAADYKNDIREGFEKAYKYIGKYKKQLLSELNTHNPTFRYLTQSTSKYTSALNLSYHPRFLQNSMDRELFLLQISKTLTKKNPYRLIRKNEFLELLNGDIPYFMSDIHSKGLISCTGREIEGIFPCSPYQCVSNKIQNFCEEDLKQQLYIIEKSLFVSEQPVNNKQSIPVNGPWKNIIRKDLCVEKAKKIGEYLLSKAIIGHSFGKRNISWMHTGRSPLQLMNDTLYDGLAGIAIMYLSLWYVTKENKYLCIAEDILYDIMCRFRLNTLNILFDSLGAFSGITSILYVALNFYFYTQNPTYLTFAEDILSKLRNRILSDQQYDIIGGAAGALLVLIKFYELTGNSASLHLAKLCGEQLMHKVTHISTDKVGWRGKSHSILTGFSHGNAGIIYALQRLNVYNPKQQLNTIIEKSLSFENTNKSNEFWLDLRQMNQRIDHMSWCNGSPGILLSRLELQKSKHKDIAKQSKKDIICAASNIIKHGYREGLNLCHGYIGNILILNEYAHLSNDRHLINMCQNIICEQGLNLKLNPHTIDVKASGSFGLMTGLTGIAYGLLYIFERSLPNVLTLQ
ncbi:type 2 lanthipeptide synthetase LanM [Bacillus toyonensis]|uniref:type 2 lanthipeptide synthetase LanM n=1 Tax=Bacillus toyonensis TaxID=155322 RepID=UPI0011AA5AF6|nr:type 2 lanthipeptide synthetase LanM [Bacillus toyonensis]